MQMPAPLTRDVVLIGGGHTHALVLRTLALKPVTGARLTLINPGPTAAYSGMLPGHVAGHYPRAALDIDLVRLARLAGARLILGAAARIDPEAREVHVPGRPPVAYDLASLDIGVTSEMPGLPGFADHAVPAKPLGPFADRWAAFAAQATAGDTGARAVVIGGGIAGIELAMAMAHRLVQAGRADATVTLVERDRIAASLGRAAQQKLRAALAQAGVTVIDHATVTAIDAARVTFEGRAPVPFDFCVGTAATRPHGWLSGSGLALTDGFVDIDDQLRSIAHPEIYAVGDCAHMGFAPRPKAGVYAVRQAPVLAHNLRAALVGLQRRRYHPQRDYLQLISLGGKTALVDRGPFAMAGPALWRWKDRIDTRFMDQFRQMRPMDPPALRGDVARGVRSLTAQPLCGGCGAKVGAGGLASALAALPSGGRDDVLSQPGDDAAVIEFGNTRQVVTTDHLRAVVEDPVLMTRIAALHALGDVWAMGAAPQAALATVIMPRMSEALQASTLREITATAHDVFADAGATLAGGHTTQGADMTLGFSITGLVTHPVTLDGARPGDVLLLTRAIGSGTLLAGEMRGKANGGDMADLYAALTTPQGAAAMALAQKATAMTDVTGFGLAGHLFNMLRASDCGAEIMLDAVPVFAGAEALAARGVASTLTPANRAHLDGVIVGLPQTPRAALLFDPQTCGGFLAAVPAQDADAMCDTLTRLGHPAARVGSITDGAVRIMCR